MQPVLSLLPLLLVTCFQVLIGQPDLAVRIGRSEYRRLHEVVRKAGNLRRMRERDGNARAVLGHGYGVVLVAERGETVLQNFRHHVAVCAGERRVRLEYELYGLLCCVRRNSGIGCGGAVRRAALSRVCGGKQHHSGQNAAYHPFFH